MIKYLKLIYTRKTLLTLLSLAGLLWLLGLYHRYIEADEYVLGEYSYTFLKEGTVRLKTIPEILNWDVRVFSHHRFFTWYGAFIIQVFGWSIMALKTSILPFYALFFLLLHKYFQLEKVDKNHFLIATLLIFTCPIILLKSFSFRPDVLLMTEGMAILYFLRRYRLDQQWKYALIAGGIAGLAFLTHLNGVAFCITGFFFLLIRKDFKALIPYVGAGALVGGLYFIELLPPGNFDKFIYELNNWPTVQHGANYIGGGTWGIIEGRFVKLFSEHKRFFWGDRVLAFSVIFFLLLIFKFRFLKKNHSDVLLFLLLLVLSLNLFGSHVAERYVLFYYSPMVVISAFSIAEIIRRENSSQLLVVSLVLVLQLAFAIKMVADIYDRSYDTANSHKEILSKIANDEKPAVLVPFELVYNEYPNYNLYTYKTYEYLQEDMPKKMTSQGLFVKASHLGMEYIIVNERMADDKGMWFYDWDIETPLYSVEFKNDKYALLKRISAQPN